MVNLDDIYLVNCPRCHVVTKQKIYKLSKRRGVVFRCLKCNHIRSRYCKIKIENLEKLKGGKTKMEKENNDLSVSIDAMFKSASNVKDIYAGGWSIKLANAVDDLESNLTELKKLMQE